MSGIKSDAKIYHYTLSEARPLEIEITFYFKRVFVFAIAE